MSLLDNRFRVDPSIEQVTFVIYRADNSLNLSFCSPWRQEIPYAWRNADNVRWYEESSMDIISNTGIQRQALGKRLVRSHLRTTSLIGLTLF